MIEEAKKLKVGELLQQTHEVLKDLPRLPDFDLPFCRNTNIQNILSLKTPPVLILYKVASLIITLGQPYLLQSLSENIGKPQLLLSIILKVTLISVLKIYIDTHSGWLTTQMSQNYKMQLSKQLFTHQLRDKSRNDYNDVWVRMNNDADSVLNYHNSMLSTMFELVKMVFAGVFLYNKMQNAVYVGFAVAVLLATINYRVALRIGKNFDELNDIRTRKINAITFLTNRVHQLKMCRLENYIYDKMITLRGEEYRNLVKSKLLDAVCVFAWQVTAILISSVSIVFYVLYLKGNTDKGFNIVTIIMYFTMMIMPLNNLPWSVSGMRNGRVSRDRIQEQLKKCKVVDTKVVRVKKTKGQSSVVIEKGEVTEIPDHILAVSPMTLKNGKVYAVKGQLGAGKSLFMRSLVGLASSNYPCKIQGTVDYIQPSSTHLLNSLCSVHSNPDVTQIKLTQELKNLLINFHCLEIPLKNPSDTYSGGQKLRLALVRATMGKDVVVVDCSLGCLDNKVRQYVETELKIIAKQQNKIFIVESDEPLSEESIIVKDKTVKLLPTPNTIPASIEEHSLDKRIYCDQNLKPLQQMFNLNNREVKFGQDYVGKHVYLNYYSSKLHILFLLCIIAAYFFKHYYNFFITSQANMSSQSFCYDLMYLVIAYVLAVVGRSLFFALANLSDARRVVEQLIRSICFYKIDEYRTKGAQQIALAYTNSSENVGNSYPFHSNILFNNIFQLLSTIIVIVIKSKYYAIVPIILLIFYFRKVQQFFANKSHALEDMAKFANIDLLQTVQSVATGKAVIQAAGSQQGFINYFEKSLQRQTNIRSAKSMVNLWMTQRFQTATLIISTSLLFYAYFNTAADWNPNDFYLTLIYCAQLSSYLGFLVQSIAETDLAARNLRKMYEFNHDSTRIDTNRMTPQMKKIVQQQREGVQELSIRDLWFKYPNEETDILKGLNLTMKPKDKIMIRGKTGAGKTTIFKILTGLYPQAQVNCSGFISFSPQKPLLLEGSLEENLDPYNLIPTQTLQNYVKKFSKKDVKQLPSNQQLKINMFRAELYGKNGVIVYDQPGEDIYKNGTCLIVSHHGDYKVDRKFELRGGVLQPLK